MTKEEMACWAALPLPNIQKKKLLLLLEQGAEVKSIKILTKRSVGTEDIYMTIDDFGHCERVLEKS